MTGNRSGYTKGSLSKNRIWLLGGLGYLAAVALMLYIGIGTYDHYKKELIASEQDELLTMAEAVGQSLVGHVEQELDCIDLYCLMMEKDRSKVDQAYLEDTAREYIRKKGDMYTAAAYVDRDGRTVPLYGTMEFSSDRLTDGEEASICGKSLVDGDKYRLYIVRKLHLEEDDCHLVFAMDLDALYKKIVAPIRIGEGGYSIVKDSDLSIIMHHAQDQIGMDAVYDRSERYPDLDLEDLSAWIELQRTRPEGVGLIHTYVWDDPGLEPIERIIAYTTIELPGETWIVNSTLPFKEIDGPLWRMLYRLLGLSLLFIGSLSVSIAVITRDLVRSRSQKKEISYLREINEGMELLRRKEEELQHYQRLQTIGQMSSHIAHEFNNYLTPVMVYAELLEGDQEIGEEDRKLVQGILRSTDQAVNLSRKLLDFSRQEAFVLMTTIDLKEDVESTLEIIRQLAPQKIVVEDQIEAGPFFIRGRKGMIEHILMNLCNNAFHAMEEGGILTIRLAAAGEQDRLAGLPLLGNGSCPDREQILLSVRDTGHGMDKEVLDKIFEPFYTTKGKGKGTGLGLSVVHNIIAAAEGAIRVDTEVGKGTTFYLFFPASPGGDPGGTEGQTEEDMTKKKPVRRVMVVDDEKEILESLKRMIRSLGFHCEVFQHPAAAISKIQDHPGYCDLILTDYSMPYMNGIELCELVRKLDPGIRLLLMSAASDIRFEWYQKNAFIDGFLLKSDLKRRFPEFLEDISVY